jgi:23S rRNA pseudouridine2605 synthase
MRLARVSFAGIGSEGLRPGQFRSLGANELVELKRAFGVPRRLTRPREPMDSGQTKHVAKQRLPRRATTR